MSAYTGLSCTFSYLIREHGSNKVYDWVYAAAQDVATQDTPDHHLADALAYLAAAVISDEVRDAESKVPGVAKDLEAKTKHTQQAYEELVIAAEAIKYNELEFSDYLEEIKHPLTQFTRPRFFTPAQPIRSIQKKIDEFMGAEKTEYQWVAVEKFMTDEFPRVVESQIQLYKDFTTYSRLREDDHTANWKSSPFAYLRVKEGQLYRLLELSPLYRETADQMKVLYFAITKFKSAVEAEQESHRKYDMARSVIEQKIPDDLGRFIPYEVVKAIENKADKP
ncbi:hypothetical protein BZL41_26310 [Pseudomonas sp. PIC25]|uniref:hypothetical protein n=1 Tax=Pseudomonas sp. PIC25 TaxID=1958773 RepID=UPI000BAB8E82|nr:hypothetical protein [Pseudomonas sp. PIC25]PAU51950.1 hypothetical protein BZL41_26310 [Pseudomonas sp. PIC25]